MSLRTGITTGTCAAAAAKAAVAVLCGGPVPAEVEVSLPSGADDSRADPRRATGIAMARPPRPRCARTPATTPT